MYPELFRIPYLDYSVSSFGAMMAVGFLVAVWIMMKRMQEEGLDPELASTLLIYAMLGGILGSKIYFTIDVGLRTGASFSDLFFARAGITWYGGLAGGTAAACLGCRIHGVPIIKAMNCTAVAAAVGQALGRIGCFLVGDDYGRVTDVPWAISFPEGSPPTEQPVHPTQLYEVAWLLPVGALLWARRKSSPFLFGEYLALSGLGRIAIENWRVNPSVALGLTEPQWIGVGLMLTGIASWLYFKTRAAPLAT